MYTTDPEITHVYIVFGIKQVLMTTFEDIIGRIMLINFGVKLLCSSCYIVIMQVPMSSVDCTNKLLRNCKFSSKQLTP